MYADDVKLHKLIRCEDDAGALQSDIDSLVHWSRSWKLRLNQAKCHVISFTLRVSPICVAYTADGVMLDRRMQVRDLGVILDSKLNFACHVDATVLKAKRMLWLLIRSMKLLGSPRRVKFDCKAMLSAFNAHVRSIMEYGSVVWSGAAVTHLKRLERIQHSFLIWLACSSNQNSFNLSCDHLLQHFNVPSIKARFIQHDLMFIHNVFHDRLDSLQLLSHFHLSAPARRNRSPSLWHVPFARVTTVKNGSFCRIATRCNELLSASKSLDFFCSPSCTYKTAVRVHAAQAGVF